MVSVEKFLKRSENAKKCYQLPNLKVLRNRSSLANNPAELLRMAWYGRSRWSFTTMTETITHIECIEKMNRDFFTISVMFRAWRTYTRSGHDPRRWLPKRPWFIVTHSPSDSTIVCSSTRLNGPDGAGFHIPTMHWLRTRVAANCRIVSSTCAGRPAFIQAINTTILNRRTLSPPLGTFNPVDSPKCGET